jgi:H+/Cl- antiporter ClcA
MMGGTMRSPLTALMFGLELTHDMNSLLPTVGVGSLVGLVARRDLLRVRTNMVRHEREREALIRVLPRRQEYESTQVQANS